jgi:hypothetical protein
MKTKLMSGILVLMLVAGAALPVYANHGGGCSYGRGGYGHGKGGGLEGKFFHKAHLFLMLQEELGLSDDQAQSIKDLKLEMKKNYVRQKAEIKVLKLDIHSKLKADKVDAGEVQKLIDQKYAAKAAMAKSFVDAYLKLKGTLNDKQLETLKTLKKQWKEQHRASKG